MVGLTVSIDFIAPALKLIKVTNVKLSKIRFWNDSNLGKVNVISFLIKFEFTVQAIAQQYRRE